MKKSILICVFVLLISVFSQAEDPGRIQGQVTKAGKPVDGVDVVVKEPSLSTITDKNGAYSFDRIPPGKYTLIFTQGANSITKEDRVVTAGTTTQCDVDVEWDVLLNHALTVHAASRRTERIVDAPAAVAVVEEAEIERESAHGQLPKILETIQGVDSTQSGLYDYNLNARGFNSNLNRRILTLIDGVNMSFVNVGIQIWPWVSSSLSDFASLEMVRGPGSALYGTDAYNGVLNISSKDPRYNPGGNFSFSYGEQDTARLDLRYAGSLGRNWYFTVQGSYLESQDFNRSRNESVEYAGVPMEVVPLPYDKLKTLSAKIRLDKHFANGNVLNFEVWGMDIKGWVFSTGVSRIQTKRGYQPLVKLNFKSSHWNILAYGYQHDWEGITLSTGKPMSIDTYRLQAELQGFTDFAKGKGRLVGGFSLRREGADTYQTLFLNPKDEHMEALFGQVDYKLAEKLKLVLAGRLDFSSLHDLQISPKVGVVYTFNPGHTLRLTFNRAFQSPNYNEFFLYMQAKPPVDLSAIENGLSSALGMDLNLGFKSIPVLALGNENLKVEEITSYEIGYSNLFGRKLLVNINCFRNQLKNFISDLLPLVNPSYGPYAPPSGLPSAVQTAILGALKQNLPPSLFALMSNNLDDGSPIFAAVSFINAGKVNAQGVELNLKYFFNERWNVDLNYTWFDFEVKEELLGDKITSNSPEHRINLGMAYISDRFDVSLRYRWVDDFFWGAGVFAGPVKSYNLVDLTSNFHVGNGFSIGINISNVLDNKHYESFGGYILRRHAVAGVSYRW